jgi:hypothetical protein
VSSEAATFAALVPRTEIRWEPDIYRWLLESVRLLHEIVFHALRGPMLIENLLHWRRAEQDRIDGLGAYRSMHRDEHARLPELERLRRERAELQHRLKSKGWSPQQWFEDVSRLAFALAIREQRTRGARIGGRPRDPIMMALWLGAPELFERGPGGFGFVVSDGDIAEVLVEHGVIDGSKSAVRTLIRGSRQRERVRR